MDIQPYIKCFIWNMDMTWGIVWVYARCVQIFKVFWMQWNESSPILKLIILHEHTKEVLAMQNAKIA